MPTIHDVAKIAGVSSTTVSRYINNADYLSQKVKARIEKAIIGLNYRPNKIAQSLNTGSSGNIAVIISDISNPITANYVKGIEAVAFENNYNVIVCNTNFEIENEVKYTNMLVDKQIDGIILAPCEKKRDHIAEVKQKGIPLVFITRKLPGIDADYVGFANEDGSYKVIEHLIRIGHHRIGIICREVDYKESTGRLMGYKKALEANGISYDEKLTVCGSGVEKDGYKGMQILMQNEKHPTAIYTAVNLQAAGVIRFCSDNRIKIPHDIALASFESFAEFDLIMNPPITANVMPVFELGFTAANILLSRINAANKDPYKDINLAGNLVIRGSTVAL